MAANTTDYWESLIADAAAGEASLPIIASLKWRLHTADPTDSGNANELGAGGGYPTGGIAITYTDLATLTMVSDAFTLSNCPAGTATHFSITDGTNALVWGTYAKVLVVGKDLEFTGGEFNIVFQSNYTEVMAQAVSDAARNVSAYINATPQFVAFTASPGSTGLISNEAVDGGYSRPSASGVWGAEAGGVISNNVAIGFGEWVGAESITHVGLADNNEPTNKLLCFIAPSGGTAVMAAGVTLRLPIGDFDLSST